MLRGRLDSHVIFRSIVRLQHEQAKHTLFEISNLSMAKLSVAQQEPLFKDFSRPAILFFKFKDFPGFSRTVGSLFV